MAAPSLDGCAAKLRRVNEQIADLEARVGRMGGKSHPLARKDNARKRQVEFSFRGLVQPPPEFGVLVGEIVHNLRSPLDYLVAERIRLRSNVDSRNAAFPICWNRRCFDKDGPKMLAHLDPTEVAAFEQSQPYHGGDYKKHPLWLLKELSNLDKHHVLHVCLWGTSGGGVGGGLPEGVEAWDIVDMDFSMKEGANVFVVRAPPGISPKEMNVHANLSPEIHFGQDSGASSGWHVTRCLRHILGHIHEHIFVEPLLGGLPWSEVYEPPKGFWEQ